MNCRRVINLMSAYVDGELTGEEMLAIRRHLGTCPECTEEHESVLVTKRAVANLGTMRPRQDFVAAILAQLDEVNVPRHQRVIDRLVRVLHDKVSPVAAALAVSGAALVMLSAGEVEKLTPATTANVSAAASQQVTFVRSADGASRALVNGEPLKLANDMPPMGEVGVQFASFVTQ